VRTGRIDIHITVISKGGTRHLVGQVSKPSFFDPEGYLLQAPAGIPPTRLRRFFSRKAGFRKAYHTLVVRLLGANLPIWGCSL
jgi:hypothetical protein